MTYPTSALTVRASAWPVLLLISLFLMSGGRHPAEEGSDADPAPVAAQSASVAEDQIFNEDGSAPSIASSLIEGGLSAGAVDGGGVLDASAEFADPIGEDAFRGTSDDDLSPVSMATTVDAGDNAYLPADRFDLDADGDTSEPVPVDLFGAERVADGGTGMATVDLGAIEFGTTQIARETETGIPSGSLRLGAPYPNPAGTAATVTFTAGQASHARIAVYDLLGREVLVPFDGSVTPGIELKTNVDVSSLPAGLYLIRLESGSRELETRLTVAR